MEETQLASSLICWILGTLFSTLHLDPPHYSPTPFLLQSTSCRQDLVRSHLSGLLSNQKAEFVIIHQSSQG